MYGQCLVTPTILDSYEFAKNAPASWKAKAEAGFLAKLRREKVDYPSWVGKGLEFEDTVYQVCNAHHKADEPITMGSLNFQQICNSVRGGVFQEKLKKAIDLDGEKAFFFGFCDVLMPEKVIDLKTTLNYKGPGKYLKGHQHLIYPWITDKSHFEYLIAQWEAEDSDTIQAVHLVPYVVEDKEKLEQEILDKTFEFFQYLRANDLWLDYYQIFSKN